MNNTTAFNVALLSWFKSAHTAIYDRSLIVKSSCAQVPKTIMALWRLEPIVSMSLAECLNQDATMSHSNQCLTEMNTEHFLSPSNKCTFSYADHTV